GEPLGADAAVSGERAQEDVVQAVILARALDRLDVERLLDDAEQLSVALRVGADPARLAGGDRVAQRAVEELLLDLDDRLGKRLRLCRRDLQQVVGEAGRGLRADARQAGQLADEPGHGIGHRAQKRPGMLCAIAPIFPCIVSSILRPASLTAARIRSSRTDGSLGSITSGSIRTPTSCRWPVILIDT